MPFDMDLTGLDKFSARFHALRDPDATDLMLTWQNIIRDGNRRGVLAGLDKDGNPLAPVTYRPDPAAGTGPAHGTTPQQRHGQHPNRMHDLVFAGRGPWQSGLHNNLTTTEYKQLTGPPLAPRGQFSRVISNLRTGWKPPQETGKPGTWLAFAYWDEVYARDGETAFLIFHFDGWPLGKNGPAIVRDLRGVRPEEMKQAAAALRAWAIDRVRSSAT